MFRSGFLQRMIGVTLATAFLTACVSAPGSSATMPEPALTPQPTPASASTPYSTPDLTTKPQIWFGPLDPSPPDASRLFSGYLDFFALFEENAPWESAADEVDVFKLYGGWVAWVANGAELRQVVEGAGRRGMALAFESGPLTKPPGCTQEIEGFAGIDEVYSIVQKMRAAGGTIVYVDLEHPYDAATFAPATGACRMTPEEIARNVSRYVETVRDVFPEAMFGAVETARHDVAHVANWVEAYRAVMGEDLAYFHLDMDYGQPDWPERALEIETYLRSQGIEFGLFYFGDWYDTSDEQWLARAEERFVTYEAEFGGRPDHAIFQSWHPHPERLLPETDAGAFTYLINRYTRTRTEITLDLESIPAGGLVLSGTLQDASGTPITDAPVAFSMQPMTGPGFVHEYTISGIVPEGANEADVGYRINLECDCSSPSDLLLYEVRYTEGAETHNRIPNPDFSAGFAGWGAWGTADWMLEPSDLGSGRALHVAAQPDRGAAINSAKFPATAGAQYTVTFVARVSPDSQGSGYFNLIFDNGIREIRRITIPLEPADFALGEAMTDAGGAYRYDLSEGPSSIVEFQAWYSGDQDYWPAFAGGLAGIEE